MSNSDSFIDEVTEEVRKEQLFGYIRRYGWIAVVVVLVLVGGTAFSEFRKAQATHAAKAAGDGILAALSLDDDAARSAALADIDVEGGAAAVTGLLTAANQVEVGDAGAAFETLGQVAVQEDAPQVYRDLALLKSAMITGDGAPSLEERTSILEGLAQPGGTFRLIALEQLALMEVEQGNRDAALDQFAAIAQDADVTRGLRDRAIGMIVALDGDIEGLLTGFGTPSSDDQ